jgi:hypothetical protein
VRPNVLTDGVNGIFDRMVYFPAAKIAVIIQRFVVTDAYFFGRKLRSELRDSDSWAEYNDPRCVWLPGTTGSLEICAKIFIPSYRFSRVHVNSHGRN